ncbi:Phospholipid-transporting ATPase 2 [Capsicum chinense]|nr:Phospholipid-transporting ATPase 2 [Capsicum chinense]
MLFIATTAFCWLGESKTMVATHIFSLKIEEEGQPTRIFAEAVEQYAQLGLRTLCLAWRDLEEEEYHEWSLLFKEANSSLVDREWRVAEVCQRIEHGFEIIGVAAIEDRLQDAVPETIETLRKAGINFWMLTGDKQNTAIQIARSCNFVSPEPKGQLLLINGRTDDEVGQSLERVLLTMRITNTELKDVAFVVDGWALEIVLKHYRKAFTELAILSRTAICCRVTPSQKAQSSSASMVKGVRITGDSIIETAAVEMGDLREMMQNLVIEVEENAISCSIGGLKTEFNIAVKITKPSSLSQAYKSARMQEAYLFAMRQHSSNSFQVNARKFADQKYSNSKGILPTPSNITSGFSKGVNKRTLSIEEMNDKRARGLYYFCNDKYMPGHKCNNSKQLYLLVVDESEDLDESQIEQDGEVQEEQGDQLDLGQPVEHMEISMHALNGSLGFRTLKVTVYHSKMELHILIDTRSSHNFIDPDLVSKLGCEVNPIKSEVVVAANGSMQVDKMTTITWLLQGVEFCADFLLLPLGSCGVVLGV